jgi:choline transport protein
MISLQLCSLMLTYAVSISCVLYRRLQPNEAGALPPARWSLGVWGIPVNVVAVLYSVFVFFWTFWPEQQDVDRESMNYAVAIFGGIAILALAMFVFKGRKVYKGPVAIMEKF